MGEQCPSIPTRLSAAHALEESILNFLEMIRSDTPTKLPPNYKPRMAQAAGRRETVRKCYIIVEPVYQRQGPRSSYDRHQFQGAI